MSGGDSPRYDPDKKTFADFGQRAMEYFLSCDWGGSSFRLRLASAKDGAPLAQVDSEKGATVLAGELGETADAESRARAFAAYLKGMIELLAARTDVNLRELPVMISGMATSAHGWMKLPYAQVPFSTDGADVVFSRRTLETEGTEGRSVFFLSGVKTDRDVMRGEETEVIGLMRMDEWRKFNDGCVVVMPGTHSKHIAIENAKVTDFKTYLTGELFELLARGSVLRHTVRFSREAAGRGAQWRAPFREGVREARGESLMSALFRIRAEGLLGRRAPAESGWFLSGLLIGSETWDLVARRPGAPILLCAGARLGLLYEEALNETGAADRLTVVPRDKSAHLATIGHAVFLAKHGCAR